MECVLACHWVLIFKIVSHKDAGRGRPDLPVMCSRGRACRPRRATLMAFIFQSNIEWQTR